MNIITLCNEKFKPCLDRFVNSWKGDVYVYTDTDKFGERIFDTEENDWKNNMTRKIEVIEYALDHLKGHILYLDADCYMKHPVDEVFKNPQDIIISRMVRRKDRINMEPEINAGVIFLKNNRRTKKLVKEWKQLAKDLFPTERYHEQTALSKLCLDAFDGLKPYTCGVISERVYNCEHDIQKEWIETINKYNPKILHFKNSWWRDDFLVNLLT